jgi:hypothetical protein
MSASEHVDGEQEGVEDVALAYAALDFARLFVLVSLK